MSDKETVKRIMEDLEFKLVHEQHGDYESGIDGYLVYRDPTGQTHWRLDFYEDSYDNGYYSGMRQVTGTQKMVTVWE